MRNLEKGIEVEKTSKDDQHKLEAQPTRQSLAEHDSAWRLPQDTGKISRRYYEIY